MNILTSIFVLITSLLIQAFLQLTPGVFALFYHYSLGKNSKQKTDDLSLSFILGVEASIAVIFLSIFLVVSFVPFSDNFIENIFPWIMVCIFLAESLFVTFLYYRPGKYTELYIPRRLTKGLKTHAKSVKTRSDAFMLGAISSIPELILTLPLIIYCAALSFCHGGFIVPAIAIILFVVFSTIPLFIIRLFYKSEFNLAEIERLRVKAKPFFRLAITIGYIILAILAINNGILK